MVFRRFTVDDYSGFIAAIQRHNGNKSAAARDLGIDRNALDKHLHRAATLGMCGTDPVLPGFAIKQIATQFGPDGEKGKEWVQQRQLGEEFQLPEGHAVKGLSVLTNPEGRIIQQWIKTRLDSAVEDVQKAFKETFKEYKGHATVPRPPKYADKDLVTVYPIADHHLGLYAWAKEVGENYDLSIGRKLLMDTAGSLIANAPSSETAVILNLGDFFHSDNNTNQTPRGKHHLDVDGRHAKILRVGIDLLIHCIQLALQRHKKVVVRCLPGNHDPYASLALTVALDTFFHKSERVKIDTDPGVFFWWRFGKVLIGSTHGELIKHHDMPGVMAAQRSKDWGLTEYRYIYLGHVHHKSLGGGEKHGAIWETFQSLSPKDFYSHSHGYSSGRSMVAITHHRDKGEVMRHTISVKGPQ